MIVYLKKIFCFSMKFLLFSSSCLSICTIFHTLDLILAIAGHFLLHQPSSNCLRPSPLAPLPYELTSTEQYLRDRLLPPPLPFDSTDSSEIKEIRNRWLCRRLEA